jgi:hypothetical protein
MKSRAGQAISGALAMALGVVVAGARIPNGSVGWKKLTPQVRERITANAGEQGPQGSARLPGAPGPQADTASGIVLTFSSDS